MISIVIVINYNCKLISISCKIITILIVIDHYVQLSFVIIEFKSR